MNTTRTKRLAAGRNEGGGFHAQRIAGGISRVLGRGGLSLQKEPAGVEIVILVDAIGFDAFLW